MRGKRSLFLTSFAIWLILTAVALPAELATLTVHADRPGVKISPTLYGIFFEEINRAGDGGLYGEMIQNRSFEDDRGPNNTKPSKTPGWTLVRSGGAEATMALDGSKPLGPKNPTSLRLEIARTAGGRAGVANEGFKGIALVRGAAYVFSLYARCGGGFRGPLAVSLEDKDGTVCGSARIDDIGPEWKKFECPLTSNVATASARLVLASSSPGVLWLDVVSLFPKETWKGRANGLRPDLAEMLAEMKPGFVRFPGGCYVEGNKLANAFRWKQSIGDVAGRPGHWNLWGYRSTDGLGYYEYLQMCEDLKAEPLFVINCGMAHEDHVPMDKMGPWVQDALDAVEYAKGPTDSRWGALRAKHGHPAPFGLKYMEIGNENGGSLYQERYRLFYDAIKARYPDLHLVADERTSQRPTEILDEHYYSSPEFFISRAGQYDKYDRKGPKIYVGEYAVTEGCGLGNLRAALGEAAFMTGMERNADVVVMASYAPLFVNCGWREWSPNAINFDCSRAYGTPSYQVQQMFGRNRGDVVLATDLRVPLAEDPFTGGAIGVGTWSTQAEFKDIKVTRGNQVLFQADFSKGLAGWRKPSLRGRWEVRDGTLRQTGGGDDVREVIGDRSWKDYTYTLKARKLGGAEGFLILFNLQNDWGARSWWNIGGWQNTGHGIELPEQKLTIVPGKIETNRWYDIRIELRGAIVRCYLDGKLIQELHRAGVKPLHAVASHDRRSGDVILKVVNVCAEAQATQIVVRGLEGKVMSATATVLASAKPEDENSLTEPTKVVPVSSPVIDVAASFKHTFPAHSVTVLRLKVEK